MKSNLNLYSTLLIIIFTANIGLVLTPTRNLSALNFQTLSSKALAGGSDAVNAISNAHSLNPVLVFPNPVSYSNLTFAFNAINAGTHGNGAVSVEISSSFSQPDSAYLNAGVFTSCIIRPTTNVTISGNIGDEVFPRAMIVLNGADNVTIDGRIGGTGTTISLTLNNSNTTINAGSIKLQNGSNNNIVKYVQCIGVATSNTSGGRTIYVGSSTAANGGNNNNIIESCLVVGGRRGIQTFGTPGIVTNNGTIIRSNRVKNQSDIGIFLGTETRENTCSGNEIFMDSPIAIGGAYRAIQCQSVGLNEIRNNSIHDLTSSITNSELSGIHVIPIRISSPGSNITAINTYNNFVSLMDNNSNINNFIHGIYLGSVEQPTAYTANVFYNSIRIGGSANTGYSWGLFDAGVPFGSILNVFNNIIINERTGGSEISRHVGLAIFSAIGTTTNSDYNLTFASDTTGKGWHALYNSTYFKSLDVYKDSTCELNIEQHSMFKNVNFVSNTDLHLAGPVGGDVCGKLIPGVNTDIDGTTRSNAYPYIGADEGPSFKVLSLGAYFQGITSSGRTSQLKVALRNTTAGAHTIQSTCTADLSSFGIATLCFGDSISDLTPYYIVIEENGVQNSFLETWSTTGQFFSGGLLTYHFETALTQAFGNNMGGSSAPFFIYGGDVNQDGIIDASDFASIDNSASNFFAGCRIDTDVNNDGIVDASDLAIVDNNAFSFISVMRPKAKYPG